MLREAAKKVFLGAWSLEALPPPRAYFPWKLSKKLFFLVARPLPLPPSIFSGRVTLKKSTFLRLPLPIFGRVETIFYSRKKISLKNNKPVLVHILLNINKSIK